MTHRALDCLPVTSKGEAWRGGPAQEQEECWALTLPGERGSSKVQWAEEALCRASQGVLSTDPGMMEAGVLASTRHLLLLHGATCQGVPFRMEALWEQEAGSRAVWLAQPAPGRSYLSSIRRACSCVAGQCGP